MDTVQLVLHGAFPLVNSISKIVRLTPCEFFSEINILLIALKLLGLGKKTYIVGKIEDEKGLLLR